MNQTSITQDNFLTSLRYLIATAGAYAAGRGWITSDAINAILAVASVVGPLTWGLYVNWQKSQQTKTVAAVGVQAGINLAASGAAVDAHGEAIKATMPDGVGPKQVTIQTATSIVKEYGPDPTAIAKV